ncbi:hypothetical protein V8C34DRAFT_296473 [Trichoderma compactum]
MDLYVQQHDRPAMHDAIRKLKAACVSTSPPLTPQEAALRWIVNHSALGEGDGDIVGAKRVDQLESNVKDARAGPLPEHVRDTIEGLDIDALDLQHYLSRYQGSLFAVTSSPSDRPQLCVSSLRP